MPALDRKQFLYRNRGVALLRAAAAPLSNAPNWWPDPSAADQCREWLLRIWSRPDLADAIRQASSVLAERVDAVAAGERVRAKQVRRAAVATARYLLRATGRPTPFGLFAGVSAVSLGLTAEARWRADHQPLARVDTGWLADIIDRLEACPELLERLDVVFNNLAARHGGRLDVPHGPETVSVRYTSAVAAARDAAASPIRFGALADKLSEIFAGRGGAGVRVRGMLTELVRHGFLITCLRAPLTITDPLCFVIDRLYQAGAEDIGLVAPLLEELGAIWEELNRHNHPDNPDLSEHPGRGQARATLTERMRRLSAAGRTPLAVDLRLACNVRLPEHLVAEMEQAASALLRLTRQPAGESAWRAFHAAFCERYGTSTLVPLADVVDPGAGLGYPAGYPDSLWPSPAEAPDEATARRDEELLGLAWQALVEDSPEIVLTDEFLERLSDGDGVAEWPIPPHVELAARVHAPSLEALQRGEYRLTVAPARAAGTLTSRFTPTAAGSGLDQVYRELPVGTESALAVQLSFPPAYPHAENVCRVPAYLPHVLSLGEHPNGSPSGVHSGVVVVEVGDLALTATRDRLHLVSLSRRRIIEPQVFHALALDKQPRRWHGSWPNCRARSPPAGTSSTGARTPAT